MNSIKVLTLTGVLKSKVDRCVPEVETLWMRGQDPHLLTHQPWVAVVGTRKPTPYGTELVRQVVSELARAGVVVVSGLAYGIDVLAHRTALEAGGNTIAILPSDLHTVYPSANRSTADQITDAGCLISEHDDNPRPMAHSFLSRNRIIAALSDLVWIPEASERSGSLNTARHAKLMNVTVCASPGRATDAMSAGTNHLFKTQDARLVTSAQDMYDLLPIKPAQLTRNDPSLLTQLQKDVIAAIADGIVDITLLTHHLKAPTPQLLSALTELEIQEYVKQNSIGQWSIQP